MCVLSILTLVTLFITLHILMLLTLANIDTLVIEREQVCCDSLCSILGKREEGSEKIAIVVCTKCRFS